MVKLPMNFRGRNVLITGGAGFVGHHLVNRLLTLGHSIFVIDDLSSGTKKFLPTPNNRLDFVSGDITDKTLLIELLRKFRPEVVIHTAAIHFIPYCNAHPLRTLKVNITGTRNLLECCKEFRPNTVLFTSSAAVYQINNRPHRESSTVNPIDIYGLTKIVGEDLTKLFHHETNIRTIVARFFNVYGPEETTPHVIPEIINQIRSGKKEIEIGNLSSKRDFIHIADVVDAIILLLERSREGFEVFNIGTGKEFSIKDIVRHCEQIIGKKVKIKQSKTRIREGDRKHLVADIGKIEKKIGWSPRIKIKNGLELLLNEKVDEVHTNKGWSTH